MFALLLLAAHTRSVRGGAPGSKLDQRHREGVVNEGDSSRRLGPKSSHAASLLGTVGYTSVTPVAGLDDWTTSSGAVGEEIYGPFENGIDEGEDTLLTNKFGCVDPSGGYMPGGIDTITAESIIAHGCDIELPRWEDGEYVSLLDLCGGHTNEYHYHERLDCLYDVDASGHSSMVGYGIDTDATPIYGKYESSDTLPELDACGAHFGATPDSSGAEVYHHHVQLEPPFTFGCYGPNDEGGLVTWEECSSYYDDCGDGEEATVTLKDGSTVQYDLWCPCFVDGYNMEQPAVPSPAPTVEPTLRPTTVPTPRPTPSPTSRPTPLPTTRSPTLLARVVIAGSYTLEGLTAAVANANLGVLEEAVATAAGVALSDALVAVTVSEYARRRLTSGVVAAYQLTVLASVADEAVSQLRATDAADFDTELATAAQANDAAEAFATVVTADVGELTQFDATLPPVSAPTPRPTTAPTLRPTTAAPSPDPTTAPTTAAPSQFTTTPYFSTTSSAFTADKARAAAVALAACAAASLALWG